MYKIFTKQRITNRTANGSPASIVNICTITANVCRRCSIGTFSGAHFTCVIFTTGFTHNCFIAT